MKLHYAIFKDNKYIKGKSTHITKTSELGLLHTSIDKAYEVLKNNPDYTSVTITLRKEPKQSKHLESASASAGAFNQMLRHLNKRKEKTSMFRIHSESTAMYSQEFHTYEDAQRALPVISELWNSTDLYIEECGHTKKITTQK